MPKNLTNAFKHAARVESAREIHELMCDAIRPGKNVQLSLKQTEELDASTLQLLLAAVCHSGGDQGTLNVKDIPARLQQKLNSVGAFELLSGKANS